VWLRNLWGERIHSGFTVEGPVGETGEVFAVVVHGIEPGTVLFKREADGGYVVALFAWPEQKPRRVEDPKWCPPTCVLDPGHHEVQIIRSASHPDEDRLTLCVEGLGHG